jgi:hypothetical protein
MRRTVCLKRLHPFSVVEERENKIKQAMRMQPEEIFKPLPNIWVVGKKIFYKN